ncbi:hypothetical protein Y032_0043g900 [Ancylostoma ceylanicum]|uniref:Uncharacterized protein n=1 Tax=Ancylostoma ceylanicum TaxID=53326 RepID=A0A016UFQ1_9BILA|nr:hypothetical protein Y032_0043g900 [Ancylostoma ceylanicum]
MFLDYGKHLGSQSHNRSTRAIRTVIATMVARKLIWAASRPLLFSEHIYRKRQSRLHHGMKRRNIYAARAQQHPTSTALSRAA